MRESQQQKVQQIDATSSNFRELNAVLQDAVTNGVEKIELHNVYGQRYIGTNLNKEVQIDIYGTPGNDLGAFMDGPRLTVYGNAQDGCGNTMNNGQIIVHGHTGDIAGLSARGGKIFIRDNVGYRSGIHMKEYDNQKPVLVIGGTAQDFMGEYMAGGIIIVLGLTLKEGQNYTTKYIGTGMHGGVIYMRGHVDDYQLGKEVGVAQLNDHDIRILTEYVREFAYHFGYNAEELLKDSFIKLFPRWLRPYGNLYAY